MTEPTAATVTVLAPEAKFEGILSFRGHVRIEGRLKGDVIAEGCLRIELGASVEGRIEVDELIVAGSLQGNVEARKRIELQPTARVNGTLRTPALALAEGCILDGRCAAGHVRSAAGAGGRPSSA